MIEKLVRACVLKAETYVPGVPLEVLQQELGLTFEINKLASNENPLGPSPQAIEAIKKALDQSNLYPDNDCYSLSESISSQLGISSQNLCIGNGSTDLLFFIGFTFLNPGDGFIMSESSFIVGKMVARIMECNLIEVPLKDYRHDLNAISNNITDSTKIVYLDNPSNPIGTVVTEEEVSRFIEKIPEHVLVVFDEAYNGYAAQKNYPRTLKFIEEGKNVIITRTFSKLYGLAGLRVGYCISQKCIADAIKKVLPPFTVNRIAQIGAAAALTDEEHVRKSLEVNRSGKRILTEGLDKMDIFYIPSETNFITLDLGTDAKILAGKLQKRGIVVRPLDMYGKPTFLRVTIGTPDQNKRFLEAFEEVYTESVKAHK